MAKRTTSVATVAPPSVTVEQTEQMAVYRKDELETHNKELKAEDFANEAEYRAALLSQYQQLRQEEYRYIAQNEALKAYNLTCDGRNVGVPENNSWDGYASHPDIIAKHTEHADSAQVQQFPKICDGMGISPKGMNNRKNINKKTGKVRSVGAYSCAVTASALQMQISDKMGYSGSDNIIQPSKETELASAALSATCVDPKYQQKGNGKMTLNDMVLQGMVGVGDEVSVISTNNAAVKTASGKHAVTVAAINRNDKGEVTSYVIQGNNVCTYRTIYPNDKTSIGNKVVHNTVKTHEWANDKITQEQKNLENLSTEELARKVNEQRLATEAVIDNLAVNEKYAVTNRKNKGKGEIYFNDAAGAYKQEYSQLENNYKIRRQDPLIFALDQENQNLLENNKLPLRLDIREDYFNTRVDTQAQKVNNQSAENTKSNETEKTPQKENQSTTQSNKENSTTTKATQTKTNDNTKQTETSAKVDSISVSQLVVLLKKRKIH